MSVPSTHNFLLHITVTYLVDPVVSRTLSVPPDHTFGQLHQAIRAAFGYSRDDCNFCTDHMDATEPEVSTNAIDDIHECADFTFRVFANDPFVEEDVKIQDLKPVLQVRGENYVCLPDENYAMKVSEIFGNFELKGMHIIYEAGSWEFYHSINVIGSGIQDTNGQTVCVGAQGATTHTGWMRRLSTWSVDLDAINERVKEVEDTRRGYRPWNWQPPPRIGDD